MNVDAQIESLLLKSFDSRKTELPLFDKTVVSIMRELSQKEPDIRKLGRIILTDQSLTAQVLKVANSSFFRRLTKVATIDEAILRLGINWISNIVVLLTQRGKYSTKNPLIRGLMDDLWRHSVACGIGTLWLAERKGLKTIKSQAFIAGLLHDEGKLVILTLINDLQGEGAIDVRLPMTTIDGLLDHLHTGLGHELMRQWNLPEEYSRVARNHHVPDFDQDDILLVAVRLANQSANALGIGLHGEQPIELAALPESLCLDLDFETLSALETALKDSKVLARS